MQAVKTRCSLAAFALAIALPTIAHPEGWVEPNAGSWKTWVIASGSTFRVPPPPSWSDTRHELGVMNGLVERNGAKEQQQMDYWDAGAPSYRWIELINARVIANIPTTAYPPRVYAYVAMAMHDATIATWESKYFYNRPRPSRIDRHLMTSLEVPQSPSYPAEHSATAQAAATVLAYLLPAEAESFQKMAEEAGWSRVLAGLQYPSDHYAGLELGRKVAEAVIAKAKADGSDAVWTGTVPTGACKWVGSNPANVTAANWTPLVITYPGQFRPAPPADCTSPAVLADAAAVKSFARTFTTNYKAYYWQSPEGRGTYPYIYAAKWMFEDRLDRNPPRAARAYALLGASAYDAFIASQDAKFTYWYLRPHMLDPSISPLFPVPNFPSYPSNHSTFSTAATEILAFLFPTRASFIRAQGKEAGDSRIWAGIHFEMDNAAGVALGKALAQTFIFRTMHDGAD